MLFIDQIYIVKLYFDQAKMISTVYHLPINNHWTKVQHNSFFKQLVSYSFILYVLVLSNHVFHHLNVDNFLKFSNSNLRFFAFIAVHSCCLPFSKIFYCFMYFRFIFIAFNFVQPNLDFLISVEYLVFCYCLNFNILFLAKKHCFIIFQDHLNFPFILPNLLKKASPILACV